MISSHSAPASAAGSATTAATTTTTTASTTMGNCRSKKRGGAAAGRLDVGASNIISRRRLGLGGLQQAGLGPGYGPQDYDYSNFVSGLVGGEQEPSDRVF